MPIVYGAAATTAVFRLKMRSWQAVTEVEVVRLLKQHYVSSEYAPSRPWATRARSPAEVARTAPIGRMMRTLRSLREEWQVAGAPAQWTVDGDYRPGKEAICVRMLDSSLESKNLE